MAPGIEIAPIRIQIIEQQLQLAKELERGLSRVPERAPSEVQPGARALPVLPSLELGEIVPARVLENLGSDRYLVLIKDTPFIAESHVALAGGSDITVRVERAAPDVRLALVKLAPEGQAASQTQPGPAVTVNEYLKLLRANPDGIRNLLANLAERLETPKGQNPQGAPTALNEQAVEAKSGAPASPSGPGSPATQGAPATQDAQAARSSLSNQNTPAAPSGTTGNIPAAPVQDIPNAAAARIASNIQAGAVAQGNQNPGTPGTAVIQNAPNPQIAPAGQNPPAVRNSPAAPLNQIVQELLTAKLPQEGAARLLSLVSRLQFSGDTQEADWVRNYARDLGLTVESDLLKVLAGSTDVLGQLKENPDLKRALTEISALLQAENAAAPTETNAPGFRALSALVDSGIKNIEALQVANVVLQDAQGACAFQAPIVFQENRGTAHLFIEGDGPEATGKRGAVHKVLLLLDMDRLGALRVEASLAEGRIDCLFRCESREARDLVTGSLDSLKTSLEAAGCRVAALGCITDSKVRGENQASLNERLGMGESLSLFA